MIRRELHIEMRWLAWIAGLMEGEGTFSRATPAMPRRPRLSIGMTDHDIIERICELWGTRLYTHIPKVERYKQVYRTELVGGSAVALMALLRPHMSARRQLQIDKSVATYAPLRSIKHKSFYLSPEGAGEFDRYWLAGLLEGEAAFTHNRGAPMLELNSVDHDVILRVQRIYRECYAASVKIHGRPPRRAGYQPQLHIAVYGDAARAIMGDIAPLMGQRRAERIAALAGGYGQLRLLREAGACYDVRRAA
jgi:hypothetical protein